jgi:putative glutamine amidotransferase
MSAPLIGITTGRMVSNKQLPIIMTVEAYVKAILLAGGVPVLVPVGAHNGHMGLLRSRLDGILLTGGGDIDPQRFDGKPHPRVYDVDMERDEIEIGLAKTAAESGWPLLAICRGIQVLNVALGGSLYTDLGTQWSGKIRHDCYPDMARDHIAHQTEVTRGSHLAKLIGGERLPVNSLHHQGIERLAPGLVATAYAPDDLIEAVEVPHHPFGLGVQWHPEWLTGSPANQALFRALVHASTEQLK